jgi:hypothetical protein
MTTVRYGVVGGGGGGGGGGGAPVTSQFQLAGAWSTLPAMSVLRTLNECGPTARDVYDVAEVQAEKTAPSREQAKLLGSDAENVNVAVVLSVVAGGPESIVVSGATVSTVHVRSAEVASVFPARSRACTRNVWGPWPRPEYEADEDVVHVPNGASSSEHSKVLPDSFDEKVKLADVLPEKGLGPESIVVTGAVVSTVHIHSAGVASGLPAGSRPRTRNVWVPSAKR